MGESGHKTIVCIASGPSLTQDDCDIAQAGADMVIAVNDSYRMVPDAAAMYACDERWWNVHLKRVNETFKGKKYYKVRDAKERGYAKHNGLIPIEGRDEEGLGRNGVIHFGSNSGYQAINLAYLIAMDQGFRPRILLLGYDMQHVGEKAHWFGDHPKGLSQGNYESFVPRFSSLAADLKSEGIEVINCTRETALYQFPRAPIESCIERVEG